MAFKLSEDALRHAIRHLCRYGDTDVLSHPPEMHFFKDNTDAVVSELIALDLDTYVPNGALEALAPKSRWGFRIVHQLTAIDTVLLLACVIEIGPLIEAQRMPLASKEAYSYRFNIGQDGQIFSPNRTFRDWLIYQENLIDINEDIACVVVTDISDFYSRINFHRLENLLDECAPSHGAARFIKKHIRVIRATQSFGLPVGGSAARLLAELALSDIDKALANAGINATRYVDDFRLLLKSDQHPYDALGYLAEQLSITEGLTLNAAKTDVFDRASYVKNLETFTYDVEDAAQNAALEQLTNSLYFDDEADAGDLEKIKDLALVDMLDAELSKDAWNTHRLKLLFRALKIAKPNKAIDYINANFVKLIIFAKETCLLMQVLDEMNIDCFDDLRPQILEAILSPPATSVQSIRTWLIEIFVRGIVIPTQIEINALEALPSPLDRRQVLLLKGRSKNVHYFRKSKTQFDSFTVLEQPCVIWGASCLPKDEFDKWTSFIKPFVTKPTALLFIKWVNANREKCVPLLSTGLVDDVD